jgi:Flp pilus assembly pilin Flp
MNRPNPLAKATAAVTGLVRRRIAWARKEGRTVGASAVEWVIISAIVAALVAGIGFTISKALNDKTSDVKNCIDKASTTSQC